LKLAEGGEVLLKAIAQKPQTQGFLLEASICNTGAAISPEQRALLFDALAADDEALTESLDGTARELFTARKLAQAMGGKLTLKIPEEGSFCIVLGIPLKKNEAGTESSRKNATSNGGNKPSANKQKRKVLLAEDRMVNQLVTVGMLQDLGFEVSVARDGYEALRQVQQEKFDIILMDCHMPKMSGFSASSRIRDWEKQHARKTTPIIALTADVQLGIKRRCRAVGMDDYLRKPISKDALAQVLARWMPTETTREDPAASPLLPGENPVLDSARLDSLRSIGRGKGSNLLQKAVRHYLEHTPSEIHRLRQAIADNDAESVRLIAHNLKSASGMLGAHSLATEFNNLDQMAHRHHLVSALETMATIEGLLPTVMEALRKAAAVPASPPLVEASETVKRGGKILLVDDDPAFRLITSASLREAGFTVHEATNGIEALATIAEDPPELVLLDALMEDIDGFEICSRIKKMPEASHIPVLIVTGLEDTESVNRAFQAGAAGFITKPVNYPVLNHRIRFQLRVAREAIELRESREQLAIAQHLARLGHWRWEPSKGRFIFSEQLAAMCKLDRGQQEGTMDNFLALVHPDDREQVRVNIQSAMEEGLLKSIDYRILVGNDRELFMHQELTIVTPGILLGTVQDITRQYESEQKIRKLAYFDELTGLASRSYFLRHLEDTINIASRHQERFSLLYLDLDSFKDINDTLGHDVGDELLKVVAKRLLKALRKSDFAARLGGDEFCILVDSLSINYVAEVATRCLQEVNHPIQLGSQTFNPRVSIGIANYPGDGANAQALLKAADSAMYAAKQAGKHRYAFYRPELTIRAKKRLNMEHELRKALEEEQFVLWYQPQVSLSTGKVLGVEALVRWNHPERGLVPPNDFIHVAERIGLIQRLGQWVMENACAQAREWQETGLPKVRMSVNISPIHFQDPAIVDQVQTVLEKTGWAARELELEVTENVVQTELKNMESFQRLKKEGVRITIDDFGTGYSSLASLKKLPIDCLKVDQLFVRDMVDDPESATLVGTIVALAKALKLQVVAEGVETEEELQILTALGCDLVQGYHFSKPVPASEIPALLEHNFKGPSSSIQHIQLSRFNARQ
jgi:diguanylate cyclase (GGDEF)-like protein